jgi:hypothetical protein
VRGLVLLAAFAACATATPPPARAPAARTAPDDSDLWNLAPSAAYAIADVDLAALARSPWSRPLITGGFAEDRARRAQQFGYDVFADADQLLTAITAAGGAETSLTVARGRFDPQRVGGAFLKAAPGAAATRWRDSPLWEGGGRAIALVTSRTLVQGTPEGARAAIDAAWGIVPDARSGSLGELRRALDAERTRPAVVLAFVVTPEVRVRATGFLELPPGLRRVAGRLDLGRDLDLEARAVLDDAGQAAAAADVWGTALREASRQRMLRILGLGPLIEGASVQAAGSQVLARLHIPEERREGLAERLRFLLETIARQSPSAVGQ